MVLPRIKTIFLKEQTLNLKEENLFWEAVKATNLLFHKMFSSGDEQTTKNIFHFLSVFIILLRLYFWKKRSIVFSLETKFLESVCVWLKKSDQLKKGVKFGFKEA